MFTLCRFTQTADIDENNVHCVQVENGANDSSKYSDAYLIGSSHVQFLSVEISQKNHLPYFFKFKSRKYILTQLKPIVRFK